MLNSTMNADTRVEAVVERWAPETVVWCVPTLLRETAYPIRCAVVRDVHPDPRWVLISHPGYKEPIHLARKHLFLSPDECGAEISARLELARDLETLG